MIRPTQIINPKKRRLKKSIRVGIFPIFLPEYQAAKPSPQAAKDKISPAIGAIWIGFLVKVFTNKGIAARKVLSIIETVNKRTAKILK